MVPVDLHKTVGFYVSTLLVISLTSGLYLVFPDYVKRLIDVFSTTTVIPQDLASAPSGKGQVIGFEQAAAITDDVFPDGRFQWIFFPHGENGVYKVVKKAPDERTDILPARALWIDQYSGNILHRLDPTQYTTGDVVKQWLFPLHSGEAFGLPGRMMILILGLMPSALFLTGFIRWRHKCRSRNISQIREVASRTTK